MLDDGQLTALSAESDRLCDSDHEGREFWYDYRNNASYEAGHKLTHGVGAWRVSRAFHDLVWHPAVTVPLEQLLGGPIRLLHDQLFAKPARSGGAVAWHQDYSYWTYIQPMAHASCWIALDDATVDNGCLQYVPGSHRWGLLPITGLTGEGPGVDSVLTDKQRDDFRPVHIELKAGEAAFHHPLMVHGSDANHSDLPRRGVVVNTMRDGSRAAVDLPEVDGVPSWLLGTTEESVLYPLDIDPAGPILDGRYWPMLTNGASTTTMPD